MTSLVQKRLFWFTAIFLIAAFFLPVYSRAYVLGLLTVGFYFAIF